MEKIYYIVVNGSQEGPYSKEELRVKNLAPNTLVWRAGIQQWIKISDFPEVADILPIDVTEQAAEFKEEVEDNGWFAMIGDRRRGPATVTELIAAGVEPDTPVWHPGMGDWANASTQREFNERFSANTPPNFIHGTQYGRQRPNFGQNPQYGQQPNFSQNLQYGQQHPNFGQNRYYNPGSNGFGNQNHFSNQPVRTNWLPWAIGATIVGFLFSCIGAIFGIIGIVQANKANSMYTSGFDAEGDQANNTAKTMTIIAYVLAGIGLVATGFMFKTPAFSQFL